MSLVGHAYAPLQGRWLRQQSLTLDLAFPLPAVRAFAGGQPKEQNLAPIPSLSLRCFDEVVLLVHEGPEREKEIMEGMVASSRD